jgi:hypothetical protein
VQECILHIELMNQWEMARESTVRTVAGLSTGLKVST